MEQRQWEVSLVEKRQWKASLVGHRQCEPGHAAATVTVRMLMKWILLLTLVVHSVYTLLQPLLKSYDSSLRLSCDNTLDGNILVSCKKIFN